MRGAGSALAPTGCAKSGAGCWGRGGRCERGLAGGRGARGLGDVVARTRGDPAFLRPSRDRVAVSELHRFRHLCARRHRKFTLRRPAKLRTPAREPAVLEGDDEQPAVRRGRDRKSVVSGKSVSVRVDLGGRLISKKKKTQ